MSDQCPRSNVQAISELSSVRPERETLLTIGVFDGVHLGHRHLISRLTSEAMGRDLSSGVVTFIYHPRAILSREFKLAWLTGVEERVSLLMSLGVGFVLPLTFDSELAGVSARSFVRLLQEHLRMRGLVVGPDFALGRGREGDAEALGGLGRELGFTFEVVEPLMLGGTLVSSTAVRDAIFRGDMSTACKLLGRYFSLSGTVVGGRERGQVLGFPTANIAVDSEQALPPDGVYATLAHVGADVHDSVTNIGVRPTFGEVERSVETFLFGFDGDLYGREVGIDLVERLRGEMKFADAQELASQIGRDVVEARAVLRRASPRGER